VPCDSRFQCQITQKASAKDLGHRDNDHDNNLQRVLLSAAPRVSHPEANMSHFSRARKHSDPVVRVTKATETVNMAHLRPVRRSGKNRSKTFFSQSFLLL
jgi:hypothetical protein